MIQQVTHPATGTGTAGTTLALTVAAALRGPRPQSPPRSPASPAPRAPEVTPAPPQPHLMGLRTTADRPHRRRVALRRLDTLRT
ncbi:hypothetical protein SGM_1536 [Streptomyces griseoaurantiacus M045]|uniref:Uncharacterized protein n=1 Tax=Streptomyces griseoaurantiacus M045 TaxID=996637 RepID=F3NEH2_9ACTN|nr:hypothetical protein [Streptomyces griseoaurantiacus]EGG48241.1 hypothetical protein SGM_1536 [Streptomyces griseoaurantiacus M045]